MESVSNHSQPSSSRATRLFIREIVNLDFCPGGAERFYALVGPNGSWKRNVLNALLFVFGNGERAELIRRNKVSSELIHNSTNSVGVSVHFQEFYLDDDAYGLVPGSDFVITRTAFQCNRPSKYYIDGSGSNFTEVTKLLKRKGVVDLDNYHFLIFQGEVEQMSLSNISQMAEWQTTVSSLDQLLGRQSDFTSREKIQENTRTLREFEALHEENVKMQECLRNYEDDVRKLERQKWKQKEDKKHLEQEIDRIFDEFKKDSRKIDALTKECKVYANLILQLETNIPKLLEEIARYCQGERLRGGRGREIADVRAELESLEEQWIEHIVKLEVASSQKLILMEKRDHAMKQIDEYPIESERIITDIENVGEKISFFTSRVSQLKHERLIRLETARQRVVEISLMESEENQGSVVKATLQANEANCIPGICGQMGDLRAIDDQHARVAALCATLAQDDEFLEGYINHTHEVTQKWIDKEDFQKFLFDEKNRSDFDFRKYGMPFCGGVAPAHFIIRDRKSNPERYDEILDLAVFALAKYNKQQQTKFKVVEIVNLNVKTCQVNTYYITFTAIDVKNMSPSDSTHTPLLSTTRGSVFTLLIALLSLSAFITRNRNLRKKVLKLRSRQLDLKAIDHDKSVLKTFQAKVMYDQVFDITHEVKFCRLA